MGLLANQTVCLHIPSVLRPHSFLFFLMFMEDLDLFMYDNLYNMCMLIYDISAVYFCMLICDFIESTIVCRNKSPTGLMLCHVSHIRRKINFLYLFFFLYKIILSCQLIALQTVIIRGKGKYFGMNRLFSLWQISEGCPRREIIFFCSCAFRRSARLSFGPCIISHLHK